MPRKKTGTERPLGRAAAGLSVRLADELKSNREYGQPLIYETDFPSGNSRVTVVWDAWDAEPLEDRTSVILRAYELAEGRESRDRIALASGLTVPEAYAAGMLPYQIIAAVRKGDPLTPQQARQAMLEEGASTLLSPDAPQLRFATEEDAKACVRRLVRRFPGSEDVWIINREITAQDFAAARDAAAVSEE